MKYIQKATFVFLILISISTSLLAIVVHKYYVGVTEVHHNPDAKTLEIAVKLFTDDLEKALEESGEKEGLFLGEKNEDPNIDESIVAYLIRNFEVEVNGKLMEWRFIGKEADIEACWSYLEIEGVKKLKSLKITNSSLIEILPKQTHLIHVYSDGEKQSALFNSTKYDKSFSF